MRLGKGGEGRGGEGRGGENRTYIYQEILWFKISQILLQFLAM